ncbi:hypothetical protein Slin15195_G081200 [Septoria linicola]|uniref:Apple domain-containing protein n=1 Tax=Septoria linicola TaxID=215465 RepID=A0A9Q9AZY0_9PEZI|nr:hypothetical protein Slin14017_G042410 [Septoria linicola]USW54801.1 hypothetical protein Slin15195_G081200 [Septoria linicola]
MSSTVDARTPTSILSASTLPTGLPCPASDGQTFAVRDGSQYLIVCSQDYSTSTQNVFGLNPLTISSYLECITLCSNQGSVCAGVTYGYFGGGTLQCNLKTRMLRSNQVSVYPVDSALRISGPGGPNSRLQLISNGNFSRTDTLAPWTSDVFRVDLDTGTATTTWNLASSGRYRAGELVQAVNLIAGLPYFLAFSLSISLTGTIASTDWCNFYGRTDDEALFFFYPNLTDYRPAFSSNFNGSGTTTRDASRFIFFMYCSGSFSITWSIDDIVLYTYNATTGTNPLSPATSTSILRNGNFSNDLQSWRWLPNGIISSTSSPLTPPPSSIGIGNIISLIPQVPSTMGAGTITFTSLSPTNPLFSSGYLTQDILIDPGQTFRITADVYFNISSPSSSSSSSTPSAPPGSISCSCDSGIYNTLSSNSGVNGWAWSIFGVTSSQRVSVNVTGTTYAVNHLFQMYAGCSGSDPTCAVAFDNVVMYVNV